MIKKRPGVGYGLSCSWLPAIHPSRTGAVIQPANLMLPCNVTIEEDEEGVIVPLAYPAVSIPTDYLDPSAEMESVTIGACEQAMTAADSRLREV